MTDYTAEDLVLEREMSYLRGVEDCADALRDWISGSENLSKEQLLEELMRGLDNAIQNARDPQTVQFMMHFLPTRKAH